MKITAFFAPCLLVGCAIPGTLMPVEEAAGEKPIRYFTCSSPYLLEQDCSNAVGATHTVVVGDRPVGIAGSKDGAVVLVMGPVTASNVMTDQYIALQRAHNDAMNENYRAVRRYLDSKSVPVKRVRPIRRSETIDGYFLELGSDGYSLLKQLSPP